MSDLLFTVDNGIARITLNRPDKLNAFSTEMIELWIDALQMIRDDEEIRVVVLAGNGRAFCSGGDVKSMTSGEGMLYNNTGVGDMVTTALARKNTLWKKVQRIPLLLQEIDKPVIAVIQGVALGAGFDMTLACDIRIAAKSTKISESYVKAGIVPGDGGAYFLPRFIGVDKALELLWTGDVLSAEEAKLLGLVTHVVADDQIDEFVENYIQRLVDGPQDVLRFTKRAVYQGLNMDLRTSLDMISSAMGIVTELPDYQEGVRAILEKRKPNFE
ncbi:enoyl-CoA hydratase/isomerase family protein [Peribacillus castrilensis]|uniref:Enoyl-CoA hydratase/isomerase n=1 Tax=Peribacillus simplex TaxID=1478 RepID=A0AAN2PIE9_9BACI|nr:MULTISPECIES: enoyl-CoA hydratase-related protein [Bacillaceae]MCF7621975.1 enoyl-CoA hydratase-related protein [Peribacillus frigoritolerans]MCP1156140.1 enoyl-CoA hydratase-related protein [Peribacillus frigoritolerans]MCT1390728.1 enoyl-CoA hydratase-related protein [Peribacillus frigoritolerans]PRA86341.1 enoyl-CoA hydratase [Peribacillus simplex]WMX58608.1 enoyl-CoA hydratase-related protein [Peribacillus sp. R9-11]